MTTTDEPTAPAPPRRRGPSRFGQYAPRVMDGIAELLAVKIGLDLADGHPHEHAAHLRTVAEDLRVLAADLDTLNSSDTQGVAP